MYYLTTCLLNEKLCLKKISVLERSYQKICAFTRNDQGVCNGDSGSPLVVDGVQVGITSYVMYNCAMGYPDVFAKVFSFLDWINSTMKAN